MGKLIIIAGENNSGKSVFAENLAVRFSGKRYYIATMLPKTEENFKKIEKHIKQREKHDFTTLEIAYSLEKVPADSNTVILLEDISNLLANNIFERNRGTDAVLKEILTLAKKCKVLIAVTISELQNNGYDDETAKYIDSLNEINEHLADEALEVITMKNGKPIYEKGEEDDIS